jgi:hypothetical protein
VNQPSARQRRQLGEVLAGGRAGDAGEKRELAAGQRLSAHQGSQYRRARGVPDERRDLDQICGGNHGGLYRRAAGIGKQRQFGLRRTNWERQGACLLRPSLQHFPENWTPVFR